MATVLNKVDAVIVGFGWAGAIMAKELTEAITCVIRGSCALA